MTRDRLWAPWRRKFLLHPKPKGCIFCSKPRSRADRPNLMLKRGRHVFSILNLYPYNNGHLMIAPYRHVARIQDVTPEESVEMFVLAQSSATLLEKKLRPDGFNIGFNIGRVAGAGYDGHIHLHVVPRWNGDTNFMPVLSGDKVISESLDEVRDRLLTGSKKGRGR